MKSSRMRLFPVILASCLVWLMSGTAHLKAGTTGCPDGADASGIWAGEAGDEDGTDRQWELKLEHNGAVLQGVLEWKSPAGSAVKEGVQGVIDCCNRSFVLRGFNLKETPGKTVNTTLQGSFSPDWKELKAHLSGGKHGGMTGKRKQ